MSESKELLEATVKGLQDKVEQLTTELQTKRKELEDVSKPELNQSTLDVIYDCVTEGIEEFDFSNSDNYDFEYEIDYDGRIATHHIEFNNSDYVRQPIIKFIEDRFKIIDDTEDENSAQ
jgi:hypothetical protein